MCVCTGLWSLIQSEAQVKNVNVIRCCYSILKLIFYIPKLKTGCFESRQWLQSSSKGWLWAPEKNPSCTCIAGVSHPWYVMSWERPLSFCINGACQAQSTNSLQPDLWPGTSILEIAPLLIPEFVCVHSKQGFFKSAIKRFLQEFGMRLLLLIQSFRLKNHLSCMVKWGWGGNKEKELSWKSSQPPTTSFFFPSVIQKSRF